MSSETLASLQTTAPPRNGARVRPKRLSSFLVLEPPPNRINPGRLTSVTKATLIPPPIDQIVSFFSTIWAWPLSSLCNILIALVEFILRPAQISYIRSGAEALSAIVRRTVEVDPQRRIKCR